MENSTNAVVGTGYAPPQKPKKKRKRRIVLKIFFYGFLVIILLSVAGYIFGPRIALNYVNKRMAEMPDYTGHIDGIDLHLLSGYVTVKGVKLTKKNGKIPEPFFYSESMDVGLEMPVFWKKRKTVAFVTVDHLEVNVVKGKTPETTQTKIDPKWIQLANELMPVDVNTLDVLDGEIHYRDKTTSPNIDLVVEELTVKGRNMNNAADSLNLLPSKFDLSANIYGSELLVHVNMNMLSEMPAFDMSAKLTRLNLVNLNDILRAFAGFDVQQGTFSMYAEMAARDNKLKGYAKPIIRNLKVFDPKKEGKEPIDQRFFEAMIELGTRILRNPDTKQIATRVIIEGKLNDPSISVYQIMGDALENAFQQSLFPGLSNSINIKSPGTGHKPNWLEKLFGKKKISLKKSKKNKKKKKR